MYFNWHAAYFDAVYVDNFGSDLETYYPQEVLKRIYFVIRLDSLLNATRQQVGLEPFTRWRLVDDYTKSYKYVNNKKLSKPINPPGTDVFFSFKDPAIIKDALDKLWHITDTGFNVTEPAGQWMYSLHMGVTAKGFDIDSFMKANDYSYYERPDSNYLWMQCESGVGGPPYFWSQYETDGYYHLYTGLYLTTKNVQEAQKLLKEKYNLETTITSQYVTPGLLKKYFGVVE
jgi:hypothetical protein